MPRTNNISLLSPTEHSTGATAEFRRWARHLEDFKRALGSTPAFNEQACMQLIEPSGEGEALARRVCCSHHKGVCGCDGGRAVCCDGNLSPSCGCNREEILVRRFLVVKLDVA